MPDLSGRLTIQLRRTDAGARVTIASTRPVTAAHLFAGKSVDETARGLPMLFSVCATAQAAACTAACEQALGITPHPHLRRARALLLAAETAKELAWRLLLDWPQALDLPSRIDRMAAIMQAYGALKAAYAGADDPFRPGAAPVSMDPAPAVLLADAVAAEVLDMDQSAWIATVRDRRTLGDWALAGTAAAAGPVAAVMHGAVEGLGASAVPALEDLAPDALAAALGDALAGPSADAFVASPTFAGAAHESTPYAHVRGEPLIAALSADFGRGLLPRLAALLLGLAQAAETLRTAQAADAADAASDSDPAMQASPQETSAGIGIVRAARGLLVHRVVLQNRRVAGYRILAPTEWNFHPEGVVAAGLAAVAGIAHIDDAELRRRGALWITAIDPCVEYDLSVS
jgi:coenzyme F420-reducing hydrogenase alpha subunit